MRKWLFILVLFLGIAPQTVIAQDPYKPTDPKSWTLYQIELARLWKIQNEFIKNQDDFQGDQLFNQILFLKNAYDVQKIPALSKALLDRTPTHASFSQISQHHLYQMATKISPDDYSNEYFLCNFHVPITEWTIALKHCFDGLDKQWQQPAERFALLSKISYQAFWTMILLVVLYLILFMGKFLPFAIQYYSSNFYWISPVAFFFLIATILILIFFTFGWVFVFALIYIFLWRFPSTSEKGLLFILLCIIMALPLTFVAPALGIRYEKSVFPDLFGVESSLQPQVFIDRIQNYVSTHPKESYAFFTLGTLQTKSGHLEEAETYFKQSQEIQPLFAKTKLNLANLHYELGQSDLAKEEYKKLISQYPNLISAYINLSQIYTHESKYLEGEEYINKAKKIDPPKFEKMGRALHDRGGNVKLFFEELSLQDVSENIYKTTDSFRTYFLQFFSNYFSDYSPKLFYSTLIFAIVASFAFLFFGDTRSFYVLYANREKNYESMTLVQLKEFPKAYKRFASNLERRDKVYSIIGLTIPGVWAFINEKVFLSLLLATLFIFFFSGFMLELFTFDGVREFPWQFIYVPGTIIVFFVNFIMVRMAHVKKKD